MTEDKKPFLPLEVVKELARLWQQKNNWSDKMAEYETALWATEEYKVLAGAEENLAMTCNDLNMVEAAFRAGCEDIFIETDEKKFPGGQIKMRSTLEYNEVLAVQWAMNHGHPEMLSIVKKEFKAICKTLAPPFVTKGKVGKLYIDSDLSQYLEVSDAEAT